MGPAAREERLPIGGEGEEADGVERAERDQLLMPIKSYPMLDPSRDDPRFGELLRKRRLE